MGFIDGFLDKMKFGDNDDDDQVYDGYDDADDDEDIPAPKAKKKDRSENTFKSSEPEEDYDEPAKPVSKPNRFARTSKSSRPATNSRIVRMGGSTPMEVCIIKPTNVEDGREIANTLIDGKAVVLNLEGIDVELAQRIIDFTSGACFAINGNLQKVSNYIFIITPESVDISGDFQGYISSEGSFAQDLRF